MGGLARHGKHLYRLNRTKKERWHLLRTMVTQLVEHERITTTKQKTKALRSLAERVMVLSKRVSEKSDENAKRELQGILTTPYARKKAVFEIAPRFKDKYNCFTRIKFMEERRRGDNAPTAYIEYIGNDIEQYEQTAQQERYEKGIEVDKEQWKYNVLKQERDFFTLKLEEVEEEIKQKAVEDQDLLLQGKITQEQFNQRQIANNGSKAFFEQKLQQVEHDIYIQNKNPFDLQRLPVAGFVAGTQHISLQREQEQLKLQEQQQQSQQE